MTTETRTTYTVHDLARHLAGAIHTTAETATEYLRRADSASIPPERYEEDEACHVLLHAACLWHTETMAAAPSWMDEPADTTAAALAHRIEEAIALPPATTAETAEDRATRHGEARVC